MVDRTLFEKRINCKIRGLGIYIQLVLVCVLFAKSAESTCGCYVEIGSSTKVFYSPTTVAVLAQGYGYRLVTWYQFKPHQTHCVALSKSPRTSSRALFLRRPISDPYHSCGGYVDIGSGTKVFYSHRYPLQYDAASKCIWIIESSAYHRVNLTFSFTGERFDGECSDYIEVRDGGPNSPIIGVYCDTHSDVNIESTNVWMFVQLKSDQITGSGTSLMASAKAIRNTTTPFDLTDRVPECRSYEFECANHMCISMSYRCDNYNDCGCIDDCDEDGCGSLTIDLATQISVAVVVGVTVFLVICFMAYVIESKNSWNTHKKIKDRDKGRRGSSYY